MDPKDLNVVRSLPGNDKCFDCAEPDTQWASVSFGTLFCIECSGKHRALGVHVDFVRSLTLDSWKPEHVSVMKAGGNSKCFNAFRATKVPMAVTDGGGRNGLENNLEDFKERYNHMGAKIYKEKLLNEVASSTTTTTSSSSSSTGSGGGGADNSTTSTSDLTVAEKEEIYEMARLDPTIPWHAPIPSVAVKVIILCIRIVFGFPVLPLVLVFGFARFVLYPDNTMLQGIGWLIVGIPIVGMFLFGRKLCRDFVDGRTPPFKSAQNMLAERIIQGRAIRTERYDVFLPSSQQQQQQDKDVKKDDDDDDSNKRIGLIFYPGWLINHTAYAPIASKLSDRGILVVVMSMEPFRASVDSAKEETKRALQVMYELLTAVAPNYPVSEWAMGGHSVGAHLAMKVAKATSPGTSKIVLWACGSRPIDYRSSSLKDNKAMDVLVLNGSEDGSINSLSFSQQTDFRNILPSSNNKTVFRIIEGGNHNGFGHYEKRKNRKKDGIRKITLDGQQQIAVDETVQFLKGRKPPRQSIVTAAPSSSSSSSSNTATASSKKNE